MKILVLGATGLVGHAYSQAAKRRGHFLVAARRESTLEADAQTRPARIDARDREAVTRLALDEWPDVIVNAAAASSPEAADEAPDSAEALNVALPRVLAQVAAHLGARLLHLSTDMVFDGESAPYRSTDLPAPKNAYGQLKLAAEREVLEHNSDDPVVLRLPILTGNSPSGRRSVHEKLLRSLAAGERPALFDDEIRQPCSAENVAEALLELSERRDLHGIFHWAGAEPLSRLEMGKRILEHFGLAPSHVDAARLSERPPDAPPRPADLRLELHPLVSKLKTRPPVFREQLADLRVPEELASWIHSAAS